MVRITHFGSALTLLCLAGCCTRAIIAKTLPDLRYTKVNGTAGRFVVDRKLLEYELNQRKEHDRYCGKDVNLELPVALPRSSYDTSQYGEIVIVYLKYTDHILREELPCNLRDQIATSFSIFSVHVPTLIDGEHGFIPVATLTDSDKIVVYYQPSYKNVGKLDSIEEKEDGTVTLRHGDDVMVFQTGGDIVGCQDNSTGTDFNRVTGKLLKSTNYPHKFNWGCDLLGDNVGYCRVLREHQCELQRLGGDVCVLTHSPVSERCPSFLRIERLTGFFRDAMFLPTKPTPIESFEAEWLKRDHEMGIEFPCLSK